MAEQTEEQTEPKTSGAGLIKLIAIVMALLVLEAGTIIVTMKLNGGPRQALGEGIEADLETQAMQPVEVLIVDDRFSHDKDGRLTYFDTEIYAQVRQRDQKQVTKAVETNEALLAAQVRTIIRRADAMDFREPDLATLTRQIKAALDEQIGNDDDGQPIIQKVFIKKWNPISG